MLLLSLSMMMLLMISVSNLLSSNFESIITNICLSPIGLLFENLTCEDPLEEDVHMRNLDRRHYEPEPVPAPVPVPVAAPMPVPVPVALPVPVLFVGEEMDVGKSLLYHSKYIMSY